MKAVVINSYRGCDALEAKEMPKPAAAPGKVLVRVRASSINAGDYFTAKGSPFLVRFMTGFPRPHDFVLGWDIAGTVEEIGPGGGAFKPGDEVYGATSGAYAEYALIAEGALARKPARLSFEEAAALPTAALTALQALRDNGKLARGMKVIVNGASGGVGTCAVQIAKALGAEVCAVCSGRNAELLRSLGADRVVDYSREDFAETCGGYDLVLDNVASRKLGDLKKILAKGGRVLPNSGHGGMGYVAKVGVAGLFDKRIGSMRGAKTLTTDLDVISAFVAEGKLKPVIDAAYPLSEARAAFKRYADEHPRGKIVISVP